MNDFNNPNMQLAEENKLPAIKKMACMNHIKIYKNDDKSFTEWLEQQQQQMPGPEHRP